MKQNSPVVTLVNKLIDTAITRSASDIHLEPTQLELRVRYRIDGLLHTDEPISADYSRMVISRIKVLASMNVAEQRLPQDGTFQYIQETFSSQENVSGLTPELTNDVRKDLRIATFPTIWGEKVVVRLLSGSVRPLISTLGMTPHMSDTLLSVCKTSRGFFLVTGPTGSGKTTTLHALLGHMEIAHKNVATLEDPIEYLVDGINQSQILSEIGFSFRQGIRSLLRQDPDIIMVGEIRDPETAHAAIQAALTGHFVLSTIHTYDAVSTIMRLLDMSIEPFLLTSSLTGIVSQRLARRLCSSCKQKASPTLAEQAMLHRLSASFDTLYRPVGCTQCHDIGYAGRIGIFQLLNVSNDLRTLICERPSIKILADQAAHDGMKTLIDDGLHKVASGTTSLEEFARVVL